MSYLEKAKALMKEADMDCAKSVKSAKSLPEKVWHAEEVARLVGKEGICIFWSKLFGIVVYSTDEIDTLFGEKDLSPGALRLIHEAKKIGGKVSNG